MATTLQYSYQHYQWQWTLQSFRIQRCSTSSPFPVCHLRPPPPPEDTESSHTESAPRRSICLQLTCTVEERGHCLPKSALQLLIGTVLIDRAQTWRRKSQTITLRLMIENSVAVAVDAAAEHCVPKTATTLLLWQQPVCLAKGKLSSQENEEEESPL